MITAIIVCFILAALLGATLLTYVLSDRLPPRLIAVLHGLCAASGLVLLIIHAFTHRENNLFYVIGLFAVVALVGLYMAGRHLSGSVIPKSVAIIHGCAGIITFTSLVLYLFFFT